MAMRTDVKVGIAMVAAAVIIAVAGILLWTPRTSRGSGGLTVTPKMGRPGWFETRFEAMGTYGRFEVKADDGKAARRMFEAALPQVRTVEGLMSLYRPDSEVSRLNKMGAQQAVKLSDHTLAVLRKSVEVSRLTGGAFDVAYAPLRTLWRQAERDGRPPSDSAIKAALQAVGYTKLVFEGDRVRFAVPRMEVDLGGVAAGYGVDVAVQALQQAGATAGIVDIGGDLRFFGTPGPGEKWRVMVNPPPGVRENIVLAVPPCGVATSGDYERHYTIGRKEYSQIIDPRTGRPVEKMASVTVVAPDGITADTLSTGLSVMGPQESVALVDTLADIHCLIIVREADGTMRKVMSRSFAAFVED